MSVPDFIKSRLFTTNEDVNSQDDYERIVERDRTKLLMNQFKLRDLKVPILILINGRHASGYSRLLNVLNEWMDTRFIESHVHRLDSDEEADRPYFWKYWRKIPSRGVTGLYVGGWYTNPYLKTLDGISSKKEFTKKLDSINHFEKMLTDDGVLLVKIWLELNGDEQKASIETMPQRPENVWRVTMDDWKNGHSAKEKNELLQLVFDKTEAPERQWICIQAADKYPRDISVMHVLTNVFEAHIKKISEEKPFSEPVEFHPSETNHLKELDLTKSLKRSKYTKLLNQFKESLYKKAWNAHETKHSVVLVFEGADAAGKGGTIRRLIRCLDARLYRVIQIGAPTKAEKSMHYLWRFWMQLPRAGFITIYDRSWYGRVLVERVENFATNEEWQRAYDEINQFEKELTDSGVIVLKFWMEISDEEQLNRFNKREKTEYKQYKLTDEDWRNRNKRDDYDAAANDMIEYTGTKNAPWFVIPAEDKKYARMKVLKIVEKALSKIK